MKNRLLALLLALSLLLTLCGCGGGGNSAATNPPENQTEAPAAPTGGAPEPTPEPANLDASGKYTLSEDGEAILNDPGLSDAVATEDNYRVFYEIFVGSFSDSDGDGIGDLRGIINRMDYLNDGQDGDGLSLGIEGIWLSPIFLSGSYHKYDCNDYYQVDPKFGTEDDLKELVDLCHERNVKVILDLVINHTGTKNPWFTEFAEAHRSGNTASEYYDFYTYYTKGEEAPAGRTFYPLSGTDIYYEGNFSSEMPELNYDNEAVRLSVLDVAKYYLDLGVDGFRFDAAKYIYYADDARSGEFWVWFMNELRGVKPDIYTVAEVWDSDGITDRYFPALNCFNFTTSQSSGLIATTAQAGDVNKFTAYVDSYLDRITALNPEAMYIPFIANHDTDRAVGYLPEASGRMKVAANLYILCPGSPFLYYGEELGAAGSRGSSNTDANRRLKMEWGDGDTIDDPEGASYNSTRVSAPAVDQLANGDSLLSYYKRLIMIRKANPAIARGDYTPLVFTDTKLGGFTAAYEGTTVAVLHNTTTKDITVDLSTVSDLAFTGINACIGLGTATLEGSTLTLSAQTSAVLSCG